MEGGRLIPMRSLLFVPANSWRFILNSLRSEADVIVIDLEDAVPVDDKETGRWFIREFLQKERGRSEKTVFVRVNSVGSGLHVEDLEYSVWRGLDGIVLPKTESPEDVKRLEEELERLEEDRGIPRGSTVILPLIETAQGVEEAYRIASSSSRIIALSFGAGDFLRDLGLDYASLSSDQHELLYARSRVAVAAAARGLQAIDTPFLGLIIDREGVEREAAIAKRLGYRGKYAVHPSHVPILNRVYTPAKREVEEARGIVEAYEEASRRGLGATTYKGRMIDYMNYRQAKRLLELARLLGVD